MGTQGRVKGRCGFIANPSRGIQAPAPDNPLHFFQERHDVRQAARLQEDAGMEELQPATVLCLVKNNPIHVNVPL
jgi:hypothetical protein